MTQRLCLALDLVNDAALVAEYIRMHEPGSVWPTVIDHVRAQGIEQMEIWQREDRLFMVMDVAEDYPRRAAAQVGRIDTERWEARMSEFQRVFNNAEPGNKWSPMRRIFRLTEHTGTLGA